MALWQKIRNAFRGDALNRELDEEFESHIAEAMAQGRDPDEARRSFDRCYGSERRVGNFAWPDGWMDCAPMWFLDGGN